MLKLIIVDDEGRRTVVPFLRQEITIGRQEGNTIRLTERNVSRHHARLLRHNGSIRVEDLGSYNGVRVNGERIEGAAELHAGDRIQIGDYQLAIDDGVLQAARDRTPTRELDMRPRTTSERPHPHESAGGSSGRSESSGQERTTPGSTPTPDAPNAPHLLALNTELAGREFACAGENLKLGRSPDNDIVLEHPSLAATQARLIREASGEWQIVDLESSNGLLVNGQTFGVARLRYGDLVELGELKLKFLAPPVGAEPVAATAKSFGRLANRSFVVVLLALVVAVAAIYFLTRKESTPPLPERAAPAEDTVAGAESKDAIPPAPLQTQASAAAQAAPAASTPIESPPPRAPDSAKLEEQLKLANAAMARRDFQKAIDILQSIKGEDGARPPQVSEPLSRANLELSAENKIGLAKKSLSAGKVDDAFRLLQESAGTTAFAKEHAQLQSRAEASSRALPRKKERELKLARVAKPRPAPSTEQPQPAVPTEDPAEKLYREGISLYRQGQYADAATALNQCLRINPSSAKCHLTLASTYGKLKEPELGAQHYRRFVQLAPDDPDAPRVKLLLEEYQASKELAQ